MGESVRTELSQRLKLAPDNLEALDEADLQRLQQLVDEAAAHQRGLMLAAMEESIRHVPRLLRGPLRKLLFS